MRHDRDQDATKSIPHGRGNSPIENVTKTKLAGGLASTLFISRIRLVRHQTPPGHPERSDRIRAIERVLDIERFQPPARDAGTGRNSEQLIRPSGDYVRALEDASPEEGLIQLDQDTSMSPGTLEAALRAAGGAILAVDEVMTRQVANAFSAARPPGHHAERATRWASASSTTRPSQPGTRRLSMEPNGSPSSIGTSTTAMARRISSGATPRDVLFDARDAALSRHGGRHEAGEHNTIVNLPLQRGRWTPGVSRGFRGGVLPRVEAFRPDLIIISAGFDAHVRDPLANLNLVETDFAWATAQLMAWRTAMRAAGSSRCSRGLRPGRAEPLGGGPCHDPDAGLKIEKG